MPVNKEKLIERVQIARKELDKLEKNAAIAQSGINELDNDTRKLKSSLITLQENMKKFRESFDQSKKQCEELKNIDESKLKLVSVIEKMGKGFLKESFEVTTGNFRIKEKAGQFEKPLVELQKKLESSDKISDSLAKEVNSKIEECIKYMNTCINFNESYKKLKSSMRKMIKEVCDANKSIENSSWYCKLFTKETFDKAIDIISEIAKNIVFDKVNAAVLLGITACWQCISSLI